MRLRIGSGFGVPIYLHWTLLLLPLWIIWTRPQDSPAELSLVFAVVPLVFACVLLHEFGHVLAARYFGIGTQDVTLYPIGGVARLQGMTDKPLEELLIAIAGPFVNVAIAIALFAVLLPMLLYDTALVNGRFAGQVAGVVLWSNVLLVAFNLLPAFPMDGGRVLRALLALWIGQYRATVVAVRVGLVMAILMSAVGIYWQHYMLAVIGFFIVFVGNQELLFARYREQQLRRVQDGEEPLTVLPASASWRNGTTRTASQPPVLLFQPKISVYTWDNQTGTWRQEPGTLT